MSGFSNGCFWFLWTSNKITGTLWDWQVTHIIKINTGQHQLGVFLQLNLKAYTLNHIILWHIYFYPLFDSSIKPRRLAECIPFANFTQNTFYKKDKDFSISYRQDQSKIYFQISILFICIISGFYQFLVKKGRCFTNDTVGKDAEVWILP